MPMHNWSRVEPDIFHAFHHQWISALSDILNSGLLPDEFYALPERVAAGPDTGVLPVRKQSTIAVRHVSGDRIVGMIEILSPGNKSNRHAFRAFVDKACDLIEARVHLLFVDPFPPGPRDPGGLHTAIWAEVTDRPVTLPADKSLTLVAYECGLITRAYIEPVAVSDPLPDMPLFLMPERFVPVPLEAPYQAAFAAMPRRWREVLDGPTSP